MIARSSCCTRVVDGDATPIAETARQEIRPRRSLPAGSPRHFAPACLLSWDAQRPRLALAFGNVFASHPRVPDSAPSRKRATRSGSFSVSSSPYCRGVTRSTPLAERFVQLAPTNRSTMIHRACDTDPLNRCFFSRLALLAIPAMRLTAELQPCLLATVCRCRLRRSVTAFPLWTALPSAEYYAVIRLPRRMRPRLPGGSDEAFRRAAAVGAVGLSQVPDAILSTCTLYRPPANLPPSRRARGLCADCCVFNRIVVCMCRYRGCLSLFGFSSIRRGSASAMARRVPCLRFNRVASVWALYFAFRRCFHPSRLQGSVGVVG